MFLIPFHADSSIQQTICWTSNKGIATNISQNLPKTEQYMRLGNIMYVVVPFAESRQRFCCSSSWTLGMETAINKWTAMECNESSLGDDCALDLTYHFLYSLYEAIKCIIFFIFISVFINTKLCHLANIS